MRQSADRITALLSEDEPVAVAMARIEQDEVFTPLARELRTVALATRCRLGVTEGDGIGDERRLYRPREQ